MNNIGFSLLIMSILIISGYLIGNFFGIGLEYYMPFLLWLIALCIFNMFLDKQHVNIYMKNTSELLNNILSNIKLFELLVPNNSSPTDLINFLIKNNLFD